MKADSKKSDLKPAGKAVATPQQDRSLPGRDGTPLPSESGAQGTALPTDYRPRRPRVPLAHRVHQILAFFIFNFAFLISAQADTYTVYGRTIDVTGSSLLSKLTWTPTNIVMISSGGLQIGPALTITAMNGWFTNVFDCGDYWVQPKLNNGLPVGRAAFLVAVPCGGGTNNITNLIVNATSYVYTNAWGGGSGSGGGPSDALTNNETRVVSFKGQGLYLGAPSGNATIVLTNAGRARATLIQDTASGLEISAQGDTGTPDLTVRTNQVRATEFVGSFTGNAPDLTNLLASGIYTGMNKSTTGRTVWDFANVSLSQAGALFAGDDLSASGDVIATGQFIGDASGLTNWPGRVVTNANATLSGNQLTTGDGGRGIRTTNITATVLGASGGVPYSATAAQIGGLFSGGSTYLKADGTTGTGGAGGGSTNYFHPDDYGALGDGTTVDDAAVSNAWRAAWTAGGVFSMEGRGKTYVVSNFCFTVVGSSPSTVGFSAPIFRGGGSILRHVGTNWLMRFTNACPDIEGLHVFATGNSPGGILILGPPSNGRLLSSTFYGYTNGTAIMAEGLTSWNVEAWAAYCYRAFGFGAYCDGSEMRLRADHCTFSVDQGCTNAFWQYTPQGPVGGKWTIVGNYNGDCVLTPARGVLEVNAAFESCTNAFIALGHNLARHGYDNTAQGAGTLMLNFAGGFGNPANGGVVPANWTNAPIELNCVGSIIGRGMIYGTGWTNGWFISRNSQADTSALQWEGNFNSFDMRVFMQLSTGERILARNIAQQNRINLPTRLLQTDPTINANYSFPLFSSVAKYASSAIDAARIGYAQDISGTNFAAGMRIYYSGGTQTQFTNTPVEITSTLTVGSSAAVNGLLSANLGAAVTGGSLVNSNSTIANTALTLNGGRTTAGNVLEYRSNNIPVFYVTTTGQMGLTNPAFSSTALNFITDSFTGKIKAAAGGNLSFQASDATHYALIQDSIGNNNVSVQAGGVTFPTTNHFTGRSTFNLGVTLPQLTGIPTNGILASAANNTPWTAWNQTNLGPVLGKTNSTSSAGGFTVHRIAVDSEYVAQLTEEFFGGGNSSYQIGELGWRNISGGNGTPGAIASEANHPGIFRASTAGSANSYSGFALSQSTSQSGFTLSDGDGAWTFIFRPSSTNNTDIAVGFAPPATHFIATASPNTLAWNTANICVVSTNGSPWYLHARNAAGGPESWVSTGVASQSAGWVKAKFRWDAANSIMYLSVNNSAEVSASGASLPSLSALRSPVFQIITSDTNARDIDADFFWAKQTVTR